MALGFFNLGPWTNMSGEIGVPNILGGSQNLGDPSLRNSCCFIRKSDWQITVILLTKLYCLFFV